ncbi:hypothetical protein UC41_29505, partial [Escherichia coli]
MKKTVMILAGGLLCSSLATAADSPDLIAQAKKEGSVTFNVWYLQPQWRSFVKDFEQPDHRHAHRFSLLFKTFCHGIFQQQPVEQLR